MTSSKLLLTGRTITHLPLQYKQYKLPAYLLCYAFTIKALLISSTYLHSSPSLSSFSFPLDTIIFTSHTRTIKAVALTHHSHLRLSHSSPSPSSLSPATLTRHHPLHHSLATITFITLTRHHHLHHSHSPPSPPSLTRHSHLHHSHSPPSPAALTRHHPLHYSLATIPYITHSPPSPPSLSLVTLTFITLTRHHRQQLSKSSVKVYIARNLPLFSRHKPRLMARCIKSFPRCYAPGILRYNEH